MKNKDKEKDYSKRRDPDIKPEDLDPDDYDDEEDYEEDFIYHQNK